MQGFESQIHVGLKPVYPLMCSASDLYCIQPLLQQSGYNTSAMHGVIARGIEGLFTIRWSIGFVKHMQVCWDMRYKLLLVLKSKAQQ